MAYRINELISYHVYGKGMGGPSAIHYAVLQNGGDPFYAQVTQRNHKEPSVSISVPGVNIDEVCDLILGNTNFVYDRMQKARNESEEVAGTRLRVNSL